MDEDVELTISRLKSELESAKNEARDFEGKMMKVCLCFIKANSRKNATL